MASKMIEIPKLTCKRCGHEWMPRKVTRVKCPRCQSHDWDKDTASDYRREP